MWQDVAVTLLALTPISATVKAASVGSCELHVWPASGVGSVYRGPPKTNAINGPVTPRDADPAKRGGFISTTDQVTLMHEAGLPRLLRLPDSHIVIHNDALASRIIRASTTRIDGSTAPCYAELIVDDLFYQQDLITGRFLKALFRFRRFGVDPAPSQVFATWVKTKLLLSSPKADPDASGEQAELRTAFANNVTLFAAALAKPTTSK